MKLILLTAGIRAGSDFFHSLIDGHSQVLQFPGQFRVDKNLKLILETKDFKKKAKLFVKFYPEFFDSRKNKFDRWDRLGKKKKRYFKVNSKNFVKNFNNLSIRNKKENNKYRCLINLHLAYFITRKKNINSIKVLFVHTHTLSMTIDFINLLNIKNVDILHTIRHPLSSISSAVKSWLSFQGGKYFFSKDLFYQMNTVVNCIYDLNKLGKLHIIRLERLHKKNNLIMKKFCEKFKIKHEKSIKESTKNDLQWWGDKLTKKYLNGINKKFTVKIYKDHFHVRDLIFFQNLTKKIIKKYNYNFYYTQKNILFNLLPMKCEIDVWKNTLKNLFNDGFRWKHLLSIPIFYILRICMINKFQNNIQEKILPNEF